MGWSRDKSLFPRSCSLGFPWEATNRRVVLCGVKRRRPPNRRYSMRSFAISSLLAIVALVGPGPGLLPAEEVTVTLKTPLSPPGWALLERELLRANTAA